MSNLVDLTESLKRAVAVPGTFSTVFPSTTDTNLVETLADAFAEAQLDGFLSTFELDLVTSEVGPTDLTLAQQALVVLYAGSRILFVELMNRKSLSRYKAGPVEFEQEQGTLILRGLLDAITDRKKALLARVAQADRRAASLETVFGDLAFIKATEVYQSTGTITSRFDWADASVI